MTAERRPRVVRATTAALVLAIAAASGCGDGDHDHPHDDDHSHDVPLGPIEAQTVENTAEGRWGRSGWQVERELLIGSRDGDSASSFGRIAGICVDRAGRIYVVDPMGGSIRRFAPDGTYLARFGRTGAGPGELGAELGGCLMEPRDTLAVLDLQNFRIARFATDGTPAHTIPFDIGRGVPVAWDMTPSGLYAVQLRYLESLGQPGGMGDVVVLWDWEGTALDTILRFPPGGMVRAGPTGGSYALLTPEPLWAAASTGFYLSGIPDTYRFAQHRSDGATLRIITKPAERLAVSEADRTVFRTALAELFVAPLLRSMNITFADAYPAYARVLAGPAQTAWVQRVTPPDRVAPDARRPDRFGPENPDLFLANPRLRIGADTWDVFDRSGQYLGPVTFPAGFEPVRFVGRLAYGIWRDDLGVEYVMRVRVVGAD